ncbi:MAG: pentapeptide repeat-containing protein [Synechococcaceae cyanobacterium SM2_3_2]|nr:pentapeptide repeat-containing protein [Synechococcaceae cyanobacterium SM2_3_2]
MELEVLIRQMVILVMVGSSGILTACGSENSVQHLLSMNDCQGCNLDQAMLGQSQLLGANLEGSSLWQADLVGADLRGLICNGRT